MHWLFGLLIGDRHLRARNGDGVQRRQRLYNGRNLPGRGLLGRNGNDVPHARHMSRHGRVQSQHRSMLESNGRQQHDLRRRQRMHAVGFMPERHLHWQRCGVYVAAALPCDGNVRGRHGNMFIPECDRRSRRRKLSGVDSKMLVGWVCAVPERFTLQRKQA
jgi:hypothetical protein